MDKISIIIPVFNEAQMIENLLEHLLNNSTPKYISEIIIVDGGSKDGTQNIVNYYTTHNALEHQKEADHFQSNDHDKQALVLDKKTSNKTETHLGLKNSSKILLVNSQKGRAKQMNTGTQYAKGSILYFLHADTFPPKDFDQHIIREVKKGNNAGCFRMQFDSYHWWLRLASWLTQFSWRACRGGDQSQFIIRPLFNDIGGFDEDYTIYEDNILINELYKRKEFVVINKKIKTSARLYKKIGVWKLQYHFWTIYVKKWFGASAEELHTYYKRHIC